MIERIKLILGLGGTLCIVLGLLVGRLAFLFKTGLAIVILWSILTMLTWKKNELSENLIAVTIFLVGGATGVVFLWSYISEILA